MLSYVIVLGSIAAAFASNQFLAKSLGSNMVLQQNSITYLYGFSEKASNKITVKFNGANFVGISTSTASSDGGYYWRVALPATAGGFTDYEMTVSSATGESAILLNVMFGEVFLCSGQSNMQFGVPELEYASSEIADAENYPNVRLMAVYQDQCAPQATEPLDDLYTVLVNWSEGSSESVDHSWGSSALCWMYGKHLYADILKESTPVGLVMSSWGGTPIQAWSPQSVTDKCITSEAHRAEQKKATSARNPDLLPAAATPVHKEECAFSPYENTSLYNTMIAPFKDMVFKGALWYQGESDLYQPENYYCLQDAMVTSWRDLFGPDLAFMYVQLSTWNNGGGSDEATFRAMQESLLSVTANSTMITAADLGDPDSPHGDIHPRNKTELGRRMSLAASTLLYGTPLPHLGPRIQNASVVTDSVSGYKVRLSFDSFSSEGLHLEAAQVCPDSSASQKGGCAGAQLFYGRGQSVEATAVISGVDSVEFVPLTKMHRVPTQLSYGQADYPLMTVYNGVGAPLLPFVKELSV